MSDCEYISREVRRAFFGRFGGRLRPIQASAFEQMSETNDALVMAETGSGKTEAVMAPVAQRMIKLKKSGVTGLKGIVISPTRALASDLYRRNQGPFQSLGLRLDVATSDYSSVGKEPSDVLIRTPEGFESEFFKNPSGLSEVKDVVIDEIHLFLKSPRGTQLCGELTRLSSIAPEHRRLGLSATVEDTSSPGRSGILRLPSIIHDPADTGQSDIQFFEWLEEDNVAADRLIRHLREQGVRKVIGFVKRKADSETFTHLLDRGWLRGKTFSHHGNLSSSIRKKIEEQLRTLPSALVIATTTLEVGIDIGDIDACILFDPPPDHNAFLQRVGRAGRRSGKRLVICICGRRHRRSTFAKVMTQLAGKRSDVRPFLEGFLQQLFVYASEDAGKNIGDLLQFTSRAFKIEDRVTLDIVELLVKDKFLRRRQDSIEPTEALAALAESRELYMTFAPNVGTRVVDENTGNYIGVADIGGDGNILLGGKARKVKGVHPETGAAAVSVATTGNAAFHGNPLSVFEALAKKYERRTFSLFRTVKARY